MKFTCPVQSLQAACSLCAAAVAQRTTLPALENLKAVASADGALTLTGYDMETGIRYEVPGVEVAAPGECIVPLPELLKVMRETEGDTVTVEATDTAVVVSVAEGRFDLPHLPAEQFPDLPPFDDGGSYHEVGAADLRTLIRRTAFAADKRDVNARFATQCVLWEAGEDVCRLVGTDTKRLAVGTIPAAVTGNTAGHSLVPLKAITILERTLGEYAGAVRVSLRANDALFRAGRATVYTALAQGKFPPYAAILDKSRSDLRFDLPAPQFAARVRQAAITTDAESLRVEMAFRPGRVTMQARSERSGSSRVSMELPGYAGPELEIAFDPKYVTEFLKAVEGEPVALELTSGDRPAVFTAGDSTAYLVMPLTG